MTYLTLIQSPSPSDEQLNSLKSNLQEGDDALVSRDKFINTSFWFDKAEGEPSIKQMYEAKRALQE